MTSIRSRQPEGSIDGSGGLEIDLFPIALLDAFADLRRGLALLVFSVGVIEFFQASAANSTMSAFETAVQTVVTHAVAIAIAGLLMNHVWDFCS